MKKLLLIIAVIAISISSFYYFRKPEYSLLIKDEFWVYGHSAKSDSMVGGIKDNEFIFMSNFEEKRAEDVWCAVQTKMPLKVRKTYQLTFKASGDKCIGGMFITHDHFWNDRFYVDSGTYDWKEFKYVFMAKNEDEFWCTFVMEFPGTCKIKDIKLKEKGWF